MGCTLRRVIAKGECRMGTMGDKGMHTLTDNWRFL